MATMTPLERVRTVVEGRGEPDRVPVMEWLVDHRVLEALGCKTLEQLTHLVQFDAMLTGPKFPKMPAPEHGKGVVQTAWKYYEQPSQEHHNVPMDDKAPIKTRADFESYRAPDPNNPELYADLERLVREYKGKFPIIFNARDGWSYGRYLMGYADFYHGNSRRTGSGM